MVRDKRSNTHDRKNNDQKASTASRRSRVPMSMPRPPIAFRLIRVAKFLGPNSSAPEGGPRGCLVGWLTNLWPGAGELLEGGIVMIGCCSCPWSEGVAETGRLIPRPSKSFLDASSRGERGMSLEEVERGVVGEDLEAIELTDEPEEWVSPSVSSSVVSIVKVGRGWETAGLKRRGWGRNLIPRCVFVAPDSGGGET